MKCNDNLHYVHFHFQTFIFHICVNCIWNSETSFSVIDQSKYSNFLTQTAPNFVLLVLYIYSLCRGWEQKRKDICAALYFALLTWAPNRGFTVGRQISNIYFRATRWRNQIKSTTFKLPNAFLDTLPCFPTLATGSQSQGVGLQCSRESRVGLQGPWVWGSRGRSTESKEVKGKAFRVPGGHGVGQKDPRGV